MDLTLFICYVDKYIENISAHEEGCPLYLWLYNRKIARRTTSDEIFYNGFLQVYEMFLYITRVVGPNHFLYVYEDEKFQTRKCAYFFT